MVSNSAMPPIGASSATKTTASSPLPNTPLPESMGNPRARSPNPHRADRLQETPTKAPWSTDLGQSSPPARMVGAGRDGRLKTGDRAADPPPASEF